MAISEARGLPAGIAARPLVAADIPQAEALAEEAGWNQVAADWRIFVDFGAATALSDAGGRIVATAATLPHGGGFGWISMVLVTAAWRRRGLARWLLAEAVATLTGQGLVPLLDATPAGRAVYLGLGFRDAWGVTRLVRPAASLRAQRGDPEAADGDAGIIIRPLRDDDWPALAALDQEGFGGQREALLRRLALRLPKGALVAERAGRLAGFLLGRDGRVMRQLGPLVAGDEATARALLAHAVGAVPGALAIDLVDRHDGLGGWLAAQGFAAERPLTRMVLGASGAFADPARYVAIAGPELG
ncbi:MAG TPA: GNAT family N-acetyltransferase [Hyphomicrobiales bacterium]|nr:GNAT family N-acetyltransferase [Hyphomicrobiales bacterium]